MGPAAGPPIQKSPAGIQTMPAGAFVVTTTGAERFVDDVVEGVGGCAEPVGRSDNAGPERSQPAVKNITARVRPAIMACAVTGRTGADKVRRESTPLMGKLRFTSSCAASFRYLPPAASDSR